MSDKTVARLLVGCGYIPNALLLAVAFAFASPAEVTAKRPNIVVIMADDLGNCDNRAKTRVSSMRICERPPKNL